MSSSLASTEPGSADSSGNGARSLSRAAIAAFDGRIDLLLILSRYRVARAAASASSPAIDVGFDECSNFDSITKTLSIPIEGGNLIPEMLFAI
jgi:hypothetical protein